MYKICFLPMVPHAGQKQQTCYNWKTHKNENYEIIPNPHVQTKRFNLTLHLLHACFMVYVSSVLCLTKIRFTHFISADL